ncbi:MAG: DNA repair protein RecN, partial [Cellulomonadaceae bacterium]|nr:DNA repair protein RecN [Cellulomonadaceae bacterium]
MLSELTIENLGVIERADITLGPGLTVITGETGAGKTMLLTALSMLLGKKTDAQMVRVGATSAAAEGRWNIAANPTAQRVVDEAGGLVDDDGTVVAARTLTKARSRAHLGGRSVPAAVLTHLGSEVVTVHGQADQMRLRTPSHQRRALDTFAGAEHGAQLSIYAAYWSQRAALAAELDAISAQARDRAQEAELLRMGLGVIEGVDPQPGEDVHLQALEMRLSNIDSLQRATGKARQALVDETDHGEFAALTMLDSARRAVEAALGEDPELGAFVTRLNELTYLTTDVATDLGAYRDSLAADPAALEATHERLAALAQLTRTYGPTVDDVLAWASRAGLRLIELEDTGDHAADLEAQIAQLDAQISQSAAVISATRTGAAHALAEAVTSELHGLAMANAELSIDVTPAVPTRHGADDVTFRLTPHPGAPARPLGQGASGGEMSRVMLAIEVSLAAVAAGSLNGAQRDDTGQTGNTVRNDKTVRKDKTVRQDDIEHPASHPTLVFDEVDAGVGGKAAVQVGKRLAHLAQSGQVIVVTHLAQVAAFGDHHLV